MSQGCYAPRWVLCQVGRGAFQPRKSRCPLLGIPGVCSRRTGRRRVGHSLAGCLMKKELREVSGCCDTHAGHVSHMQASTV